MTAARAQALGANEMGEVPVLEYHILDTPEGTYTRSPEHFRGDIALLESRGYYPITVRDLASGNIDIPAGKFPVVLTFDDGAKGQYRILADGSLDPDCAVGIMQEAAKSGNWVQRASFYPLLDQLGSKRQEKLRNLVLWGYEVGSHTVTHLNLKKASALEATKELATSKAALEELIGGGYSVTSLALPFGAYPASDSVLAGGEYQGQSYAYTAALKVGGGPSVSPFSGAFVPLHINRIQVIGDALKNTLDNFQKHPELRYVSDGDPTTVSAPKNLSAQLGVMRSDLGRPVVRY